VPLLVRVGGGVEDRHGARCANRIDDGRRKRDELLVWGRELDEVDGLGDHHDVVLAVLEGGRELPSQRVTVEP
jgi:hypothetical protein